MRRKLFAVAASVVVLALLAAPPAGAQVDGADGSGTVTATVLSGVRAVTVSGAVALSGGFGAASLTGTYAVTVTETVRSGTNPWSVQSTITDLTRVGGTETIDNAGMTLTARDVALGTLTKVGSGANPAKDTSLEDSPTTGNAFNDGSVDVPQVLFRIVNEDPGTAYTNTYAGTGSIAANVSGVVAGTYTGTITYDLVQ